MIQFVQTNMEYADLNVFIFKSNGTPWFDSTRYSGWLELQIIIYYMEHILICTSIRVIQGGNLYNHICTLTQRYAPKILFYLFYLL